MQQIIHQSTLKFWRKHNLVHIILRPLSWLFYGISLWRRQRQKASAYTATVPIIVVGNIGVGGNGKTPFVVSLVRILKEAGYRVGIVSKGYGRRYPRTTMLVDHSMPASLVGDEVAMMWRRTETVTALASKRSDACRVLEAYGCDVIVCDDGLQDYSINRDIEVLMYTDEGLGNQQLLPIGPLREPLNRRKSVDYCVRQSIGQPQKNEQQHLMNYHIDSIYHHATEEIMPRTKWQTMVKPVAISAIGNPSRFQRLLMDANIEAEAINLPDHANIANEMLQQHSQSTILITEKDAIKLTSRTQKNIWVVSIRVSFNTAILKSIVDRVSRHHANRNKKQSSHPINNQGVHLGEPSASAAKQATTNYHSTIA